MRGEFDVFVSLIDVLKKNNESLMNGDIIVVSTKYISNSQGRIVQFDRIIPSKEGSKLAEEFKIKPSFAEIILRESDKVFGGISGFIITSADYVMAPNAGIDKSNANEGVAILYPKNPYLVAENLRRKIYLKLSNY